MIQLAYFVHGKPSLQQEVYLAKLAMRKTCRDVKGTQQSHATLQGRFPNGSGICKKKTPSPAVAHAYMILPIILVYFKQWININIYEAWHMGCGPAWFCLQHPAIPCLFGGYWHQPQRFVQASLDLNNVQIRPPR